VSASLWTRPQFLTGVEVVEGRNDLARSYEHAAGGLGKGSVRNPRVGPVWERTRRGQNEKAVKV